MVYFTSNIYRIIISKHITIVKKSYNAMINIKISKKMLVKIISYAIAVLIILSGFVISAILSPVRNNPIPDRFFLVSAAGLGENISLLSDKIELYKSFTGTTDDETDLDKSFTETTGDEKLLLLSDILSHAEKCEVYLTISASECTHLYSFLDNVKKECIGAMSGIKEADFSNYSENASRASYYLSSFIANPYGKEQFEENIHNIFYTPPDIAEIEVDSKKISPFTVKNMLLDEKNLLEIAKDNLGKNLSLKKSDLYSDKEIVSFQCDSSYIVLCRRKGIICTLSRFYSPGECDLQTENARELAYAFIQKNTPDAIKLTLTDENEENGFYSCVFNDGEYDVRLSLSLDNGKVCFYDALQYIFR